MNMCLFHCHISPATSVLEHDHISFRISFKLLDVRWNLTQEGFHGNKLLMHKNYRLSQPTRILLALSFKVLNYIQKSYKLFCFILWVTEWFSSTFQWAGACTVLLTWVKSQCLALKKKGTAHWKNQNNFEATHCEQHLILFCSGPTITVENILSIISPAVN